MKITVKLFAGLEVNLPEGVSGRQAELDYPAGTKVGQVLDDLKISGDKAKLVLVNGRHAPFDRVLQENDKLVVFPPVGGG